MLASNDNWDSSRDFEGRAVSVSDIRAVSLGVGAFSLTAGSKDAVLLLSLPPGSYSLIVSGVGATTGTALVEAYEVMP